MSFSWAAAVVGAGTVSCTGTTTVTGSGTNFGAANSAARQGGTIIVGGVTKNIVTVVSTTQLITDTAFGAFSAQAYTCNREVVQSGADTMGTSLGAVTGFSVTNRGDQMRTFDCQAVDLTINGVLTVDSTTGQLRNNANINSLKIVSNGSASAELIINGRKAAAGNGPFPYTGLDWLGINGSKIMQLQGSATYPAKLTLRDACIRYGADWLTTNAGQYSTITTEGEVCWILCASGSGTSQARMRQDNTTASINFTAKKTYVGVWLNFGVPQISLKGYTPLFTDGPEINVSGVTVAQRIPIEDYDSTYVSPAYYANSQIVLYGGAWTRLINNLKGTNFNWYSQAASNNNVIEFSRKITAVAKDAVGNILNDGYLYYTPVGSNVAGKKAKGNTVDITFDLSQKNTLFTSGSATTEFVFAWQATSAGGVMNTYSYFCSGTTKGAETHMFYSSRYGYDAQDELVVLSGNGSATPTFVHNSLPTSDKIIASAAAITGLDLNFDMQVMTITGSLRPQQIYDSYQYKRNLPLNLTRIDTSFHNNGVVNFVGWSMVNNGTILDYENGDKITQFQVSSVSGTGSIACVYSTNAGRSSTVKMVSL